MILFPKFSHIKYEASQQEEEDMRYTDMTEEELKVLEEYCDGYYDDGYEEMDILSRQY